MQSQITPASEFKPVGRAWLDVRARAVPAVVTGMRAGRVQLRVQRVNRQDALRAGRGRAKPGALCRRESVFEVDRGWLQ